MQQLNRELSEKPDIEAHYEDKEVEAIRQGSQGRRKSMIPPLIQTDEPPQSETHRSSHSSIVQSTSGGPGHEEVAMLSQSNSKKQPNVVEHPAKIEGIDLISPESVKSAGDEKKVPSTSAPATPDNKEATPPTKPKKRGSIAPVTGVQTREGDASVGKKPDMNKKRNTIVGPVSLDAILEVDVDGGTKDPSTWQDSVKTQSTPSQPLNEDGMEGKKGQEGESVEQSPVPRRSNMTREEAQSIIVQKKKSQQW